MVEAAPMTTSFVDQEPVRFDRARARSSAETLRARRLDMAEPAEPFVRGWAPLQSAMTDALRHPPTSIAEVLSIQVTVQAILDQLPPSPANNRVAAFNKLYTTITREVDVAVQNTSLDLRDDQNRRVTATEPEFLEQLDVEFAKLYFAALDSWNRDQDDLCPDVWEVLFRRAGDLDLSALVAAVLGVNAHINHDLSLALIETWKKLGPPPDRIHPDYLLVNKIFYREIKPLRRGFSDDWQMDLDRLAGPIDDWSQRILVKVTRARAWDQAVKLWPLVDDPDDFEQARRLMDRAASLLGEWLIFTDDIVTATGDLVTGGWHRLKHLLDDGDGADR